MNKRMSEQRMIKRRYKTLARKGRVREDVEQFYLDNSGELHKYKFIARIASFVKVVLGCLHNGFPIVIPYLWYNAWAFWPFFFVKKDLGQLKDPLPTLNHERIHVRQQWDIMVTFAPFIVALSIYLETQGVRPFVLLAIPFIPTFLYGVAMIASLIELLRRGGSITFTGVRENTCFERESISKCLNYDYLHKRKFWAVLAYIGLSTFKNYGINET